MFSRLSLFGHVWCVEGVSNYTCLCAGCRQILVLGSCPIFQLWKKVSSFIVTTSQLVPSVRTIVYAVSRKEFAFMKRNVPEEALVFTKGVFAFCIFEADEKLIGIEVK